MKRCCRCKLLKNVSEFCHDNSERDGYNDKCKACASKWRREYYAKHPERLRKMSLDFRKKRPHYSWARGVWFSHKRKYKMLLTIKELEQKAKESIKCPFCGCDFDFTRGKGYMVDTTPTLDRINNDDFITLQNTMIICNLCNKTKSNRVLEEFLQYCRGIILKFDGTDALQKERDRIRNTILNIRAKS